MKVSTTRWRILSFLRGFVQEKGYAPTVGEIQQALNISSKSVVKYHLNALEKEGLIRHEPNVIRGIEVSGAGKRARAVPLLGHISAGEPVPVPTDETCYVLAEEMVDVPANMLPSSIQAYALSVKGRLMVDALVDDGDTVILEATSAAENGRMVAAWLTKRQEATLKRVYYERGGIRLQPANESMDPVYVQPDEIQVQGRVVAVLRKTMVVPDSE